MFFFFTLPWCFNDNICGIAIPRQTPRSASGWSAERRAKHAAAIRRWKPWLKSTGPKSRAGKRRAARNAFKSHIYTDPMRLLTLALRAQRRYLSEINRYSRMKKFFVKNELLKKYRRSLIRRGRKVTERLYNAFFAVMMQQNAPPV